MSVPNMQPMVDPYREASRRREARIQSAIALLDQIATQHPTGSDAAKALFEAAHLCRFELDVCRRANR